MNRLHVAIVEDDPDDREFISTALNNSNNNLKISEFKSGTDFMKELSARNCIPDIIVTDIRMPLMSGFEVISNVKLNEETKDIPVVVLSTSGNEQDVEKATKLGAAAYYIKPFSLDEYCQITSTIISSFNSRQLKFVQQYFSKFTKLNFRLNLALTGN